MSENKAVTKTAVQDPEELVEFFVPLDPTGTTRDVLLGVNGEFIRVKRGSAVRVKRKFAEVWQHSNEQRLEAERTMEKAREGSRSPSLEM